MPPKAPESKAAKAAKAMAGGKKKAKVRARDDDARSAETLKTNDDGTRASRGVGANARGAAIGTRADDGGDFNAFGTGVALDRARSRATRAARRWRGARAGDRCEDGGLTTTTNRVRER